MKAHYPFIMFAAWLAYIISLFLPTVAVMHESVRGWAAALFAIQSIYRFYKSFFLAYLAVLGVCNILMLLSPVMVITAFKKKRYREYRLVMSAAALAAVSYFFYEGLRFRFLELEAGYYFWVSSFILASLSLFIETRFYHRE